MQIYEFLCLKRELDSLTNEVYLDMLLNQLTELEGERISLEIEVIKRKMEELENQAPEIVNEDLQSEAQKSDTPTVSEGYEEKSESTDTPTDYAEVAKSDLAALKAEFPELCEISDISELNNPLRYAALRDLGLSAAEAYLATAKRSPRRDNRSHLSAMKTVSYAPHGSMSESELMAAREIFSDISDAEIRKLYKKVNK